MGHRPKPFANDDLPMPICNGAVTPIAGMEILPKLSSCETTVACDGWGEKKENNEKAAFETSTFYSSKNKMIEAFKTEITVLCYYKDENGKLKEDEAAFIKLMNELNYYLETKTNYIYISTFLKNETYITISSETKALY